MTITERMKPLMILMSLVTSFSPALIEPPLALSAQSAPLIRLEITRRESFAGGMAFGSVGPYEKLAGKVHGEIDPRDSHNTVITDIEFAPRNARGMVEYSMDFFMLKPVDLARGNHRLLYHMNNRGNMNFLASLNDGGGGNNPTTPADAGNGFLMHQGYTIVSSGWDGGVTAGGGRLTISVPVANTPDGSPIVGPSLEEFVIDNATTMTAALTYPAATLDRTEASLTVRARYADPPVPIPASGWEYVNAQSIRLLPAGTPFQQGRLYTFTYPARDPIVAGLGYAATRDFAAFLRHASADAAGNPNPLAGDVQAIYTHGSSQPVRYMRDFVHLGFNEDLQGRPVFDGILNWIGGGSGIFLNFRFAQPGRTHRQHIGRWYPERQFPFANQVMFDPVTGKTDGRLRRCQDSSTCPRIFEVNTSNEYWVKAGSLLHTDTLGNDLPDPKNVRYYHMSSLPHVAFNGPGNCVQPRNPLNANAALRALLIALDDWVTRGIEPPASRVPRRADGTLVPSLPQTEAGFPSIPGVTYNRLMTTGDLFDYGPLFGNGILTVLPPAFLGSPYPAFVPKTDADGNEIAGIRLPEIAAPVATYTGWNLRGAAFAGDDLCDAAGMKVDFRQMRAEREAAGDPRLSIEERYPTHQAYVEAVTQAANLLKAQRLLIEEDVQRYISAAMASPIGN
ncbi:MAG: hypothetical protein HY650_02830 [Acidobacteria bacterium]|nr:hypothetical protein [Acidobacteriota bacterium]